MFIHRKDQEKVFLGKRIIGEKFWSEIKKSEKIFGRVMKSRGEIWSGKNLVTPSKIWSLSPDFFSPIRYYFLGSQSQCEMIWEIGSTSKGSFERHSTIVKWKSDQFLSHHSFLARKNLANKLVFVLVFVEEFEYCLMCKVQLLKH